MNHAHVLASASTLLLAGAALAAPVDYTTSFTDSESPAFADGGLDTQNTWVAHPGFSVSEAAGTGLVNHVNANGPVHTGTSADVTSELAAGNTITLTLVFNFVGEFANQNNGAWLLGLSSDSSGMPESSASTLGIATFQNTSNTNFWLSPVGFNNADKYDTGIAFDADFHTLTTTITRSETTNEFDVTVDLDGQSTSYTISNPGLWDGTDTAYAGFRFRGNQGGNIDSFSVISSGEGGGGGTITIDSTSYDSGSGFTINYTSGVGPVDVYRNATGDLDGSNFSLIATGETGGSYVDATADASTDPKAFYLLVEEGMLPVDP
ncbi:MAG: hypothetical protein AAGI48_07350 [Verrucomicrobiota bacterium]